MEATNESNQAKRRIGLPAWLARKKPMEPKLMVVAGHATKDEIDVELPLTIGRDQSAGLVVSHPLVSRRHCRLTQRDDYLWVKDLDSANGTFVNGKRIAEVPLRPGDKLTVGPLTFVAIYQLSQKATPRKLAKQLAEQAKGNGEKSSGGEASKAADADSRIEATIPEAPPAPPEPSSGSSIMTYKMGKKDGSEEGATELPAETEEEVLASEHVAFLEDTDESPPDDDEQIGLFFSWAQQMARTSGKKDTKKDGKSAPADKESKASEQGEAVADLLGAELSDVDQDEVTADKTVLAASLAKEAKGEADGPEAPVEVKDTVSLPSEEDEAPSESTIGEASEDELVYGLILREIRRLQNRILANYQEATVTLQVVSRLQQEQWDLIRGEIDNLYSLNELLRNELTRTHPNVAKLSRVKSDSGEEEDQRPEQNEQSERILQEMHAWLLQRMGQMQKVSQQNWKQIKRSLKEHGLRVPEV